MITLRARNVHDALPKAIKLLSEVGIRRESRNGPVLQAPEPVSTVYERPWERVIFHPERDANPFFHLYESLWMLAGRNDVAGPARYAKRMSTFSDDGETFHGAYGYRWRKHFEVFGQPEGSYAFFDQLTTIAHLLITDPTERRGVLQMWDPPVDLGRKGKDLPCNDTATFQIGASGKLNLVVFCRSNDIIWGAYGANAVHFSFLLEYMSAWIGVEMGTYTQVSVNWHGYLDTFEPLKGLAEESLSNLNPYTQLTDGSRVVVEARATASRKMHSEWAKTPETRIEEIDADIHKILTAADTGESSGVPFSTWGMDIYRVLLAHEVYKAGDRREAIAILAPYKYDWAVAGREWLQRRKG